MVSLFRGAAAQRAAVSLFRSAFGRFYSTVEQPLKFCVVGSGPAGCYVADRIFKRFFKETVQVDIIERLPFPFGLVATGVAPDHQKTKRAANRFDKILTKKGCHFYGNVCVGKDLSITELRSLYHGVILAYGAESDRKLGIDGEDREGVMSAREFVWWYNGHPDYKERGVDLSKLKRVAIIGMGNVGVDCARLLLHDPQKLATTDIADHALEEFERSSVCDVHIFGRRGPLQVSFTPKELKEMLTLEKVDVHLKEDDLSYDVESATSHRDERRNRVPALFQEALEEGYSRIGKGIKWPKSLRMHFYRAPSRIEEGDPQESALKLVVEKVVLSEDEMSVIGTGKFESYPVDLVLTSIGYRSIPLQGIAFDDRKGTIPNANGRVLKEVGGKEVESFMYVCGWVKRGPSGIIGTNLIDAEDTVESIFEDRELLSGLGAKKGGEGLLPLLNKKKVACVRLKHWKKLDEFEKKRGMESMRPRVRVVDRDQMLQICFDKAPSR